MSDRAATVRDAKLVWPTVAMLAALCVLMGLGTWQLQRKAWKEGLIAAIAARASAQSVPLGVAERRWESKEDVEYTRVWAAGDFLNDKAQFYYAPAKAGPGFHAYVPLRTPAGRVVFVNRGFIPAPQKDRFMREGGEAGDERKVVGLLRAPGRQGWFTPDNDAANNLWFWRDLRGMTRAAFGQHGQDVAPFYLDEEAHAGGRWPKGGATRLELPNRHLEYAVTWFGLAAALVAVYLVFARGRWLNARRASRDERSTSG